MSFGENSFAKPRAISSYVGRGTLQTVNFNGGGPHLLLPRKIFFCAWNGSHTKENPPTLQNALCDVGPLIWICIDAAPAIREDDKQQNHPKHDPQDGNHNLERTKSPRWLAGFGKQVFAHRDRRRLKHFFNCPRSEKKMMWSAVEDEKLMAAVTENPSLTFQELRDHGKLHLSVACTQRNRYARLRSRGCADDARAARSRGDGINLPAQKPSSSRWHKRLNMDALWVYTQVYKSLRSTKSNAMRNS